MRRPDRSLFRRLPCSPRPPAVVPWSPDRRRTASARRSSPPCSASFSPGPIATILPPSGEGARAIAGAFDRQRSLHISGATVTSARPIGTSFAPAAGSSIASGAGGGKRLQLDSVQRSRLDRAGGGGLAVLLRRLGRMARQRQRRRGQRQSRTHGQRRCPRRALSGAVWPAAARRCGSSGSGPGSGRTCRTWWPMDQID